MLDGKKALGKLEKRILYELDRDSMQTLSEIGKKIIKSPQYVEYWIRKFVDEGYIKNFIAVIDYKRLGYTYYHTYHSLRGMSPKMEDEFIQFLLKQDNVGTVFRLHGRYDVDIAIFAKDPLELYGVLSKISSEYGAKMGSSTIETHVGAYHFGRRYLHEEAEPEFHVPITGGPVERIDIDEEETRLLSALKENARASTIDLADASGLTPDVVRYRLKKLKERKIFLRATFLPGKGYPYRVYRVLFRLKGMTPEKEKALVNFFASYPNVWRVNKTFGRYQMSVDMDVESTDISRKIISELKEKFYDVIDDFDVAHVHEIAKHCYFINVAPKKSEKKAEKKK